MDLSAGHLHRQLDLIAEQGWNGQAATELLSDLRRHVVRPVVRATRLKGPAADQAEATAWAAAWDAIRRPTARTAENPGGMVWGAVRRSVADELRQGELVGLPVGDPRELDRRAPGRSASTDLVYEPDASPSLSARLGLVMALLVEVGWEPRAIEEVIDQVAQDTGSRDSVPAGRRRVPAWQQRRVARLVRPMGSPPSLVELVLRHGTSAVEHPAAGWAARSTLSRWQAGPVASLEQLAAALEAHFEAPPGVSTASLPDERHVTWTRSQSADRMGSLQ